MKLTTKSEYALLALIHLSRCAPGVYVAVDTIAKAQAIPPKFLEQLMLPLKRAGYVVSVKGQRGGYRLAKPAARISLAAVVRLFDGALAPTESVSKYFYEPTPVEREKGLIRVLRSVRDMIAATLEKTSIADVS